MKLFFNSDFLTSGSSTYELFLNFGPKRDHLGAKMVPEGILGGLKGVIGCPGRQVLFWTPFSEKICENPSVLHGLGAARRSDPDQADQDNQADEGKMVHDRQFGP